MNKDAIIEKYKEILVHIGLSGTYKKGYDIQKQLRKSKCIECIKFADELDTLESSQKEPAEVSEEAIITYFNNHTSGYLRDNGRTLTMTPTPAIPAMTRSQAIEMVKHFQSLPQSQEAKVTDSLRDELIGFCCACNIPLPRDKDYIDLVDGYLGKQPKK